MKRIKMKSSIEKYLELYDSKKSRGDPNSQWYT